MNDRCPVWGNPDREQNSAYGLLRPFSLVAEKISSCAVKIGIWIFDEM